MSEASEKLKKWCETGEGTDIDDVALTVLAEHEAYGDELGRLMSVVGDDDFELIRGLLGYQCDLFGERIEPASGDAT